MRPLRSLAVLLAAIGALAVLAAPAAQAKAPKRIAALTPFTANTLAQLGVKPVAVGETLGGRERFNRRLRGVRTLPLSHPNGPNLEQLASINPDLVFNSPTFTKGSQGMRALGISVKAIEPRSVSEIERATLQIGAIVGKRKQAKKLAAKLRSSVKKSTKGIRDRPTVLLILGVGRTPFAFLPGSWGGDLVRAAGGTLLTEGLSARGGFARISDETVVADDPDVIIAVPHAAAKDIPSIARYLRTNPAWSTTRAVRDKRVYVSTDNSLLQAGTDPARVIRTVRTRYLKNAR